MNSLTVLMHLLEDPQGLVPPGSLPTLEAFINGYLNGMATLGSPLRERSEELELWDSYRRHVQGGTSFCGSVYQCFYRSGYDDKEAWQNMRRDLRGFLSKEATMEALGSSENLGFCRKEFEALMHALIKEPHMYLGTSSLLLLVQFLNGLIYAVKLHSQDPFVEEHFSRFEEWLQATDNAPSKMRWDRLLAIKAGYNEIFAMEKFCEFYKEFLKGEKIQ